LRTVVDVEPSNTSIGNGHIDGECPQNCREQISQGETQRTCQPDYYCSMKANKNSSALPIWRANSRWKNEPIQIGKRRRRSTLCRHLEDIAEKVLPGVQCMAKREHESYPQKNITTITITNQSHRQFLVFTHHQNNRALLPDCFQENLHHWLTHRRCDRRPVIEKSKLKMRKQPRITETTIAVMLPIGRDVAAL
jgi:hypothetical protein